MPDFPRTPIGKAVDQPADNQDEAEVIGHAPRGPVTGQPVEDETSTVTDLDPEVIGHAPRTPVTGQPVDDTTGTTDTEPES